MSELLIEKFGHQLQAFLGFGQLKVIPEGVRQCLKDNQLRIVPRAQQSAMKQSCITQQQIARAGDQQRRGAFR